MHLQDHISGVVSDDGAGVVGGVVEELVDFFHCVLCGGGFMWGEGPERSEQSQIDGVCIVQEDADELLDTFLSALERVGGSSSPLAYCTFFPYAGLTWGYG